MLTRSGLMLTRTGRDVDKLLTSGTRDVDELLMLARTCLVLTGTGDMMTRAGLTLTRTGRYVDENGRNEHELLTNTGRFAQL